MKFFRLEKEEREKKVRTQRKINYFPIGYEWTIGLGYSNAMEEREREKKCRINLSRLEINLRAKNKEPGSKSRVSHLSLPLME